MKKTKRISVIFGVLTIVLLCAMCCVVSFSYANLICAVKHKGTSAPAEVALLLLIPFGIGIVITSTLCYVFCKKSKK